jgi:hypothetical protein
MEQKKSVVTHVKASEQSSCPAKEYEQFLSPDRE